MLPEIMVPEFATDTALNGDRVLVRKRHWSGRERERAI